MRPTLKWTLVALSGLALVGVAAAATPQGQQATAGMRAHFAALHGRGGPDPWHAIHALCDDNMTVGECKEIVHGAVHDAVHERYQECLESNSQDYCDGRLDQFKAQHPRHAGGGDA